MQRTTAIDTARRLRDGSLDAVELLEATLDRIARDPDKAVFIDLLPKRAKREAEAARRRLREGRPASPLDGVPIGWKDLFDIEGRVTLAGSTVLRNDPPAQADAALVAVGARAGLVSVGTLNMTEFAYSGIGINPHYGTPRNPNGTGPARAPGGSSSASGVAVANGMLPLAIGTDTGGSIRIPASFNGVVGLKTSTGRYPMDGVFPLSRTLDTLGPLANTVADCLLADAVLRGRPETEAAPVAVSDLELVVPTNVVFDGVEPAVADNFERSLERLAKAGASVVREPVPQFDAIVELVASRGNILPAEALHVHWDRVHGEAAGQMDPRVLKRILMAEKMTAVDLVEVLFQRRRLIAETIALVGRGFFAFPTTPHVAMPIAPLEADMDVFFAANFKTLRNTMLGNFLDWCGVQIPSGRDADGMPTGFLLSAPHGRDSAVQSAALAAENLVKGDYA
ncbi:MAG: amidase [Rhizobiaceae bacterium]|nr:MAG: amidase [Rhizobiaceae bacterium]CAG0968086.1 indoleacetamide hydrolase [Rhizobiaceae bacterium]